MGLDTFASQSPDDIILSEDDVQAFSDADIHLCGGVFSGSDGSFRGKVYSILLMEITNVSLYQDWIPPETVLEMYTALMECDLQEAINMSDSLNRTISEVLNLRKFFKVCVERNLGLLNW